MSRPEPEQGPRAEREDPSEAPRTPLTARSWRWVFGVLPWLFVVGLLALLDSLGCAPAPDDDDATTPDYGDDDDTADDDDATLGGPYPAVFQPEFDAVEASRFRGVWVDFSARIEGATLTLVASTGEPVAGTAWRVGEVRILFVPEGPLDPSQGYTATVVWGERSLQWSFGTAAARPALGGAGTGTVAWAITDAGASSPPGAEGFVGALPLDVLLAVSGEGPTPSVLVGVADVETGTQDLCVPTFVPTGGVRWEDPLLVAAGGVMRLAVDLSIAGFGRTTLPLRDARFMGELEGDGAGGLSGLAEGAFFAWLDAREVTIPNICDTLEGVAIQCVPCPDGAEQCLVFWLEDVTGPTFAVEVVPRSAAQVKADPGCQPEE